MVLAKIVFAAHLKQSSFWPLADVKPMPNDLEHAVPLQSRLALYYTW
jgi:hypothetical protein